ncbi:MAG: ABC transporter ATP-binding protein [Oligoflexus sp.]
MLLSARGLKKSYGKVTAVAGIDLEVQQGECLALLGPNGAGKTTTVEMLEGLQEPDEGSVTILNMALKTHKKQIMEHVGVMLQDTQLYKKLTVKETVSLFASFFKTSLPVDDVIRMVELQEKADARLEHLSGGQKQRAYLACALINAPQLLFLDEPTTGLDPQARRMIWDLLATHKGQDRGILLTTHYMDEAEQLADRVAVIDHGKIIAEGSPDELIRKYCGEHVLAFAFDEGLDQKQLQRDLLQNLSWFTKVKKLEQKFELTIEQPVTYLTELTRAVDALGLSLVNIEMRRSTLEDVFLNLTGRSMRDA